MKTRSEMLKEKKDKAKSSAAERTVPMYEKGEETEEAPKKKPNGSAEGLVTCEACEEEMPLSKLDKREDGTYECMHCAAPINVKSFTKPEKKEPSPEKPKETKSAVTTRTSSYCGTCGAEWPHSEGKFHINCGHNFAVRVDDPRKATKMQPVTASGTTTTPKEPVSMHASPIQNSPSVAFQGNRMSVQWGKASFPVGESKGFKFSNMEVGSQIITVDLPENADRVEAAKRILAELQQIADIAFDVQYKWYQDKLGIVSK